MKPQLIAAFATSALVLGSAFAQEPKPAPKPAPAPAERQQDPRAELKESMRARYGALSALRDAGKVGETPAGEVKLVKAEYGSEKVDPKDASKGTVAELVAAENKDRHRLYDLLAKELKVTPAEVGKQNGARNLDKASPDHWIEVEGKWVQRKTVKAETKEKPPASDKPPSRQ